MTTRPGTPTWPLPSGAPGLRLRDPSGVVAAVPYLLGFVPRRSLVVVGVERGRDVGATLRADLPEDALRAGPAGPGLRDLWRHARTVLRRNGCVGALVVVYGDTDPGDLGAAVADRLVEVLDPLPAGAPERTSAGAADGVAAGTVDLDLPDRAPAGADDLAVLDAVLVGPTRFRSLLCPDPACCPAEGSPLAATGSHPVAASFVLAGRVVVPDRDALEPVPPRPAPEASARAHASAGRARGRRPAGAAGDAHDAALLEEWLGCLPEGPGPDLAGRLAAGWRARPLLRDACLGAFLPGGDQLARWLLAAGGPAPHRRPPRSLAGSLSDPGCAVAGRAGAPVLRAMAALVPAPERADVLAAQAWLSWASGEGTAASVLAERALGVDPGQSLARLVLQCLEHGLGAPWTVARTARTG